MLTTVPHRIRKTPRDGEGHDKGDRQIDLVTGLQWMNMTFNIVYIVELRSYLFSIIETPTPKEGGV